MWRKQLAWLWILTGCAAGILAPDRIRQAEFREVTTVKRSTAYHRALQWFDKKLRAVPGAARTQDLEAGRIKMEAAFECNVFRKPNDLKPYYLTFSLDFMADPGAVLLHFTQLRMEDAEGRLITRAEAQLNSAENTDKTRPCLKKMVTALMKAVESKTPAW